MAKKSDKNVRVVIVWFNDEQSAKYGRVETLTYGNGEVRVYERDKYDSRCGEALPYFADLRSFLLLGEVGKPAQIKASAVRFA